MFTCKDCVHYEVCEDAREFDNYEVYDIICDHAKNKADFVEVKHGEWKIDGVLDVCSVCGRCILQPHITQPYVTNSYNFCPYCGADMRKEGADNG